MTVREAFEEEVCCIQTWARVHFDILGTISIFNGARNHVWVQSISCYVGIGIFSYLYSTCECFIS